MNTLAHVDHSKGDPRLARRTRSVKAKPVAGLECFTTTPFGTLRGWKRCDPATGPKDVRCRGRSLGTRFDKVLPPPERGDKEPVLLGAPISGRDHKGRMQKRLPPRSPSFVESTRSSRRSDSGLVQCAGDTDERLQKKNWLADIIFPYRHKGICRSVGTLLRHRMSLRSGSI
jgi:hypothetical protein